jgi:UDP-N-acetylmuramoyl-L-alanyl-D-glutamate--2,6-diaminopimelate ligase
MKRILKKAIPQKLINTFKHKPTAVIANVKNLFPSRGLKVIGVTGTDGKTTTVNMIYHILKDSGKKVSMVSTINAVVGEKEMETGFHVTSPSPFLIQKILKEAKKAGSEYVVLEATSHALDQHRFLGIKFDIGVITNITHEHLDYHKTFKNYLNTKAKLIKKVRVAVLNRDEDHYSVLAHKTSGKILSFGVTHKADFNPKNFPLKLKIPGQYNILNALAASAVCSALGTSPAEIRSSLANFTGLLGRMEEVKNSQGIKIVVDFAHTPNGLQNALKTLREGKKGRVISLIGAEGERDEKKRPIMGEIAQKYSDLVIVTAVDPRGQLEIINQAIKKGCLKAGGKEGSNLFFIPDRKKAIEFAINEAKKGDIIGIFGKGHEKSMNLDGKEEIAWSDINVVRKILDGRKN